MVKGDRVTGDSTAGQPRLIAVTMSLLSLRSYETFLSAKDSFLYALR